MFDLADDSVRSGKCEEEAKILLIRGEWFFLIHIHPVGQPNPMNCVAIIGNGRPGRPLRVIIVNVIVTCKNKRGVPVRCDV